MRTLLALIFVAIISGCVTTCPTPEPTSCPSEDIIIPMQRQGEAPRMLFLKEGWLDDPDHSINKEEYDQLNKPNRSSGNSATNN